MEVGGWKYGSSSVMEGWDGPSQLPYFSATAVGRVIPRGYMQNGSPRPLAMRMLESLGIWRR